MPIERADFNNQLESISFNLVSMLKGWFTSGHTSEDEIIGFFRCLFQTVFDQDANDDLKQMSKFSKELSEIQIIFRINCRSVQIGVCLE